LEFFRRDPKDFLSRLVTMDETWLYHYDPETKPQSMDWRRSGSSRPSPPKKNPSTKISWKSSRPDFFGIKTASLIIFQRTKLSTRSVTNLCWCNSKTFEGKTPREGHQGDLVLAWKCPGSPSTNNPEETGLPGLPVYSSPTVFSGSGSVGLPPVPWTEKTIESYPFFVRRRGYCCREDLVGRTTFWIFFWVACKSHKKRAKKCIAFCGEHVE